MIRPTPAYIWEPPNQWHAGLLREHVVAEAHRAGSTFRGPATLCGVTYMSLPDNFPPIVHDNGEIEYDKPWYYDHDAVVTFDCMSCKRLAMED